MNVNTKNRKPHITYPISDLLIGASENEENSNPITLIMAIITTMYFSRYADDIWIHLLTSTAIMRTRSDSRRQKPRSLPHEDSIP